MWECVGGGGKRVCGGVVGTCRLFNCGILLKRYFL